MNAKQKLIIVIGSVLLLISSFYPTWTVKVSGVEIEKVRGYLYSDTKTVLATGEILNTIKRVGISRMSDFPKVKVDYDRMKVERVTIVLLTIGAIMIFRGSKAERTKKKGKRPSKKEEKIIPNEAPEGPKGLTHEEKQPILPVAKAKDEWRLPNLKNVIPQQHQTTIMRNPPETVTLYRCAPKGVEVFRPGDWVSLNKRYAVRYGPKPNKGKWGIISRKVRARDVVWTGAGVYEFFYIPAGEDHLDNMETGYQDGSGGTGG